MDSLDSDRSVWFDHESPGDLREFLLERGAVEYLSFLSQEQRRFVEMQDESAIGDGTLTESHACAEGLQLRRIDQQKRDGKYYRVYLEMFCSIDEKHGIIEVMFLSEFP